MGNFGGGHLRPGGFCFAIQCRSKSSDKEGRRIAIFRGMPWPDPLCSSAPNEQRGYPPYQIHPTGVKIKIVVFLAQPVELTKICRKSANLMANFELTKMWTPYPPLSLLGNPNCIASRFNLPEIDIMEGNTVKSVQETRGKLWDSFLAKP